MKIETAHTGGSQVVSSGIVLTCELFSGLLVLCRALACSMQGSAVTAVVGCLLSASVSRE